MINGFVTQKKDTDRARTGKTEQVAASHSILFSVSWELYCTVSVQFLLKKEALTQPLSMTTNTETAK